MDVLVANPDPQDNDPIGLQVQDRFLRFLREYTVETEPTQSEGGSASQSRVDVNVYMVQVKQMQEYDQTTMYVNFTHLLEFDEALSRAISQHYYRVEPYLRACVHIVVSEVAPEFAQEEREKKEFFVSFHGLQEIRAVRDLKTDAIGHLVAINGTVTRTSEVRPELLYGVFVCQECGAMSGRVEQQFKYTEPTMCATAECGNRSKWTLDVGQSKFVDWQRVRVQENSDEIPPGSMPRSVDVILRNAVVETAKAGDKCTFAGSLIVVPDVGQLMKRGMAPRRGGGAARNAGAGASGAGSEGVTGLKALGVRDLTYRTAFLASSVVAENSRTAGADGDEDADAPGGKSAAEIAAEEEAVVEMSKDPRLYENLIQSIAPTVHGHTEIKRGILLMLLGGLQKNTKDGIRLRGDVNVCIVGDPATAKSQFLKYTAKFVPRSVYTSGKASSAAGLTASVAKDPDTGEFTIEAGALMLADNGVCCIDEFDKMDPADQVAIHEAMEQQTISITKAGIQATLNARTSILAAANPIYGRYDKSKPLRHNITLSAAIMSRFDLFFVVLDELSSHVDEAIAKHIVDVHRRRAEALSPKYDMATMQRYIKYARTVEPMLTPEAGAAVVNAYQNLRKADVVGSTQTAYRITVRQLESLIRLSEALARLHLDAEVKPEYVNEAYRLLRKSIIHVESAPVELASGAVTAAAGAGVPGDADGSNAKGKADEDVVTITPQKWAALSGMLIHRLKQEHDADKAGLQQDALLDWYLDEEADNLPSEAAMVQEARLVKLAVDKLVEDGVVYVLEASDAKADGAKADAAKAEEQDDSTRMLAYNFGRGE